MKKWESIDGLSGIKLIRQAVLYLLGSIGIGFSLLILVYLLPVSRMQSNVLESIEVFYTEGVYPEWIPGSKGSQLDNETDAIMLLNAIYPGGGGVPQKMRPR